MKSEPNVEPRVKVLVLGALMGIAMVAAGYFLGTYLSANDYCASSRWVLLGLLPFVFMLTGLVVLIKTLVDSIELLREVLDV